MKTEQERLRAYYDEVKPSDDFEERLLALKPAPPKPTHGWKIALAAAATLVIGVIGWRMLDLGHGSPNLVLPTEPSSQTVAPSEEPTEPPFEAESIPPSASEEAPLSSEATEPPETQTSGESSEPVTSTHPTQPTEPTPVTEPNEEPANAVKPDDRPSQPSTVPTEHDPSGEGGEPMGGDELSVYGWYGRSYGKEYIYIRNSSTGETLTYDVTGRLGSGYYSMQISAFGVTLQIEIVEEKAADVEPATGSDVPTDGSGYFVEVTILN